MKRLRSALTKSENNNQNLNKTTRINNKKLVAAGIPPTQTVQPVPEPSKAHLYGKKTKDIYCQKCWDVNLKRRKHKEEDFDDELRRQAVEKRQKKVNEKAKGQPQQQPSETPKRKFADTQYDEWACK